MRGPWPKSCDECQVMREMGAKPDPDPCDPVCIFETFGRDALRWFSIFRQCAKQWEDTKTKQTQFELDYSAIRVVFDAYGIDDLRSGLDVLHLIAGMYAEPPMPEDLIFEHDPTSPGA